MPTVNPTATMDEPKTAPIPDRRQASTPRWSTRPRTSPTSPRRARTGGPTRTETDSLGSREIPADAYWGVHTSRALENFPIAKRPISVYPDLIVALASVKQAAARANLEIGVLEPHKADLIDRACQLIIDGALPRPVRRRRHAGRRRHLHEHERQRGHREHRARARRPREGRLRTSCTRSTTSTAARAPTTPIPTAIKIALTFALAPPARRAGAARATRSPTRAWSSATS